MTATQPTNNPSGQPLVLRARRGEILYRQGEPAGHVVVLREGRAQVFQVTDEGKRVVLETVSAPSLLGEAALAGDRVHTTSAEMRSDGEILVAGREAVASLLQSQPDLAANLLAAVSRRLQTVGRRLHDRSLKPVPARLATALLQLAPDEGDGVIALKQSEIAEVAGASRETATRILNRFAKQGLIALERARVRLLRPDALGQIAALGA